jgi:hypothetical protein
MCREYEGLVNLQRPVILWGAMRGASYPSVQVNGILGEIFLYGGCDFAMLASRACDNVQIGN